MNTTAILLAAGEGTRMKSSLHKVLHLICGKAMIDYPLDLVRELGVERPVVVVGHGAESVRLGAAAPRGFLPPRGQKCEKNYTSFFILS